MEIEKREIADLDSIDVIKLQNENKVYDIFSEDLFSSSGPFGGIHKCHHAEMSEITTLWNSLPAGRQARCHIPGFAIRVWSAGEVDFLATICWQCNNIKLGGSKAQADWLEFDADSYQAQALLKRCKELCE